MAPTTQDVAYWRGLAVIGEHEFFRDTYPDDQALRRARAILQQDGWLPADGHYSGTSASLLMRFLRNQGPPDLAPLIDVANELTAKEQPEFPQAARFWVDLSRGAAPESVPHLIWVDPRRIFPNREYKDKGDWTREEGAQLDRRNDSVQGLAEFARRIARERGDVDGLIELLGPDGEVAYVDLEGWETPLGAFFRVNVNGNHRAAAFGVLGAPCIPATVKWNLGPHSASSSTDTAADEALCSYRALLHCYGVASYPDPENFVRNADKIASDWPFLIDSAESAARTLPILERIAGRRHDEPIGRLPRELFDDAGALLSAGRRTRGALSRNLHEIIEDVRKRGHSDGRK